MKIAVISDIHANVEALRAVFRDIAQEQVDQLYCTGDLVGYAPFPNEVINLMREMGIPTVMGNYDDGVGNMRLICGCDYKDEQAQVLGEKSISWTKENTTEENKEFLRNLPQEIRFNLAGKEVLLVHGSPLRLNEYLDEKVSDSYLFELLENSGADILVCGHTHKPYYKLIGHKMVINAGSVGKPKQGSPEATYALIEAVEGLQVHIKQVPYNIEVTAKAIEESDLPNEFARLIRLGSG